MTGVTSSHRSVATRRVTEIGAIARNTTRLLAGARMSDGRHAPALSEAADTVLDAARSRFALPETWRTGHFLRGVTDVAVVEVCDGTDVQGLLKVARSPAGDESLLLQHQTLLGLGGDSRLGPWRRLLPDVLAHGTVGERRYSLERKLPGTVGSLLPGPLAETDALLRAGRAAAEFHRATGRAMAPPRAVVGGWMDPVLSLISEVPMLLGPRRRRSLIERLRERVRAGLDGRVVWVSRTHGDYVASNLLFDSAGQVGGIIDWGQSREGDLALVDQMTLLLTDRAHSRRAALGEVVLDLCGGAALSERERALLDGHVVACPAEPVAPDVLALLAWLRHVGNNLLKSPRYRSHPVWVHRNVEAVLKAAGTKSA